MKYEFIAVDIQNEFAMEGGKFYTPKPSVSFLKKILLPFFKKNNIKINEIVSDYRQPRPGDSGDGCHPGERGYESLMPDDLRKSLWVKCMNSPIWIRENIGKEDAMPGSPYPDSKAFEEWVNKNIGKPDEVILVIFGLTVDCCVMCVVQELRWRGYAPIIIKEAVDHASGKDEDKNIILEKSALRWWAKTMDWEDFLNGYLNK